MSNPPTRHKAVSSSSILAGSSAKPKLGDGISTAATPEGAAQLAAKAESASNTIGFSGSAVRRRLGGPLGPVLNAVLGFLFGKDPEIFDAHGRVRHDFPTAKWKAWDDRIRVNKQFDWHNHSGKNGDQKR